MFIDGPMFIIAHKDAAAIAVESEGNAEATQEAVLQQAEIAWGSFRGEELSGEDFAGSIILHAESGEQGAATFEPSVGRAVQLHEFPFASGSQTSLAMSRGTAFARRADAGGAEQAAKSLATQREAFLLAELFAEMVIIEAGVAGAGPDAGWSDGCAGASGGGWDGRGWREPEPRRCLAGSGL